MNILDTDTVTFQSSNPVTVKYAVIYGPCPRWEWCKYLPKSWQWAWPVRLIAFYNVDDHPACH